MRNNIKDNLGDILNGKIKILYSSSIKIHILKQNIFEYKCRRCGIIEWEGEQITLEIEHIDGDNWNNKLENLELLCPNCHSLTNTYRSKKSKTQNKNISDEEMINYISSNKDNNINQILNKIGLDNSGGNYKRIYKICKENNISVPQKQTQKPTHYLINKIEKAELKTKELQEKIDKIKNSNIDFDKRGWSVQVSKILNIAPQAVKQWMLREMFDFYNQCYHHIDNK
jgi:predicted RNA-binding Zn-ribbon protein involved in translation (DUF1610 family)